ncbi:MAG: galactose-1-phosphate uridylyltransferase [Deltaproteobacteria bacterium]|nr:galactose-1-phosphate uridylyltransferase [Deltaproteobacteria bacterium]
MSELRKDPIVDRWVIISRERGKRPSEFSSLKQEKRSGFCPFCPGNEDVVPAEILAYRRPGSQPNDSDWRLRVVPNKFPALHIEGDLVRRGDGVYDLMHGIGAHEVVIENPDHQLTLATMPLEAVEDVLWAYRDRIRDLSGDQRFRYILVFKNQGLAAGATVEHSHSQIIALPIVPKRAKEEMDGAKKFYDYKERCIFCDIIQQEINQGVRLVSENQEFIAVCPYAPRFPFEVWILPKRHTHEYQANSKEMIENLALTLSDTLKRLNRVLDTPPYNFILHTAPVNHIDTSLYYHWHIEIIPKLTRVAGFEWGSGFYINPTPPEESARFLREARI